MAHSKDKRCIVDITKREKLKLHFLSVVRAVWFLLRRAFTRFWKNEKKYGGVRDKPLPCLVDNSIGSHSYIKLQGVKLHYVEAGNKNSPLVLLLHGFPDCWLGWRHQIKVLSEYFRVIAVDLKGFGDSDKPSWRRNYKIQNLLDEIYELIFSLQYKVCTIIGHDLGAHIGWYFVTEFPEIVEKFVAISCPHPNVFWEYTSTPSRFDSRWIQFCQIPLLAEIELSRNDISIIDELYSHLGKEKDLIDAYKYVFSRIEDWTAPINYYRNLPFHRIIKGKKATPSTLLIVGNRDPYIQLESIMFSTEFIKKHCIKVVKNAGHFPHQEHPDYVNNLILQFLTVSKEKTETMSNVPRGLMGSLYSNTMRYGNSLVDGVKKTTNGVVRLPSQMLMNSS